MNLNLFVHELIERGQRHDDSKFEEPELSIFAVNTELLGKTTYGSVEYENLLEKVKVATTHHYDSNRHHTEHWENGVNDMSLVDLIEMICDWKAATQRHKDGDIRKSLEINAEKYKFSPQLKQIFANTINDHLDE